MKTSSSKLLCRAVPLFLISVAALVVSPQAARAQGGGGPFSQPPGPNGFGAVGQLVFDGTAAFSIVKVKDGNTTFLLRPAVDYFIIPNVTVGGVVAFSTQSGHFARTLIALGVRAGVNFNINDKLSIWPTGGFSYAHADISDGGGSSSSWAFNLYAPFLFHAAPHFFLGAGPFLDVGLSDNDTTAFGIQSVIGGWF
jgi:opacity protein-like surface antigen